MFNIMYVLTRVPPNHWRDLHETFRNLLEHLTACPLQPWFGLGWDKHLESSGKGSLAKVLKWGNPNKNKLHITKSKLNKYFLLQETGG